MQPIPIVRGNHIAPHLQVLGDAGLRVEQRLAHAGLPDLETVRAGGYLPLLRTAQFLEDCAGNVGVDDLALRGALASSSPDLDPRLGRFLHGAVTLQDALHAIGSLCILEAPSIRWRIERRHFAVGIHSLWPQRWPGIARRYCEWYANVALIKIVRSFAGQSWYPAELAFQTKGPISRLACERFPATRLRTGARYTGMEIPRNLMTLQRKSPREGAAARPCAPMPVPPTIDFVESLQLLLESYVREPTIRASFAAELAGTSVRTLQRRLNAAGLSFSELVQRARFDAAARLLHESDQKLVDIAFELGWSDPSHFSRAFRRISGMSPREFRSRRAA